MKKRTQTALLAAVMILIGSTACGVPSDQTGPQQSQQSQSQQQEQDQTPQQAEEQLQESEGGILARQSQRETEIIADYEQGSYTFAKPYIIQDPYEFSPLSALVLFETESGVITVTVPGDGGSDDVRYECMVAGDRAEIPVLGLYPGRENLVELKDAEGNVSRIYIRTEPLPEDFPQAEVVVADRGQMAQGLTFLSEFAAGLFAVDTKGDVRWWINEHHSFGYLGPIQRLENGRLAVLGGGVEGPYYMESVYETDFLGKVYREYKIPGNSGHHEIRELTNGNLLVAAGAPDGSTHEDHVIEFDRQSGEVIKTIDLKESIPMPDYIADPVYVKIRVESGGQTQEEAEEASRADWFHNNSFYYDENDNSLILSARSLDGVFKINYGTGELLWVLADPAAAWTQAPGIKEKLLTPSGSGLEYQYGQHSVQLLPEGDVLLFDNGGFRSKDWDTIIDDSKNYSRAVRYRVNESDLTVEQVWQYGKERGNRLLSCFVSNIDLLGEGHYLINFGGIVLDEEGRNSSDNYAAGGSETVIVELKGDKVVFEVKLSGGVRPNTYRAYRMNLY